MAKNKMRKKLSLKERILVTALVIIGVLYITNNMLLAPAKAKLTLAQENFNKRLAQKEIIENEISHKITYQDRIDTLLNAQNTLVKRFPTSLEQDLLLMKVNQFAKDTDVYIASYSFSGASVSGLAEQSPTGQTLSEEEKIQAAVTEKANAYTAQVEEDIKKRYEDELGISSDEDDDSERNAVSFEDLLNVSENDALKNQLLALNAEVITQDLNISVAGSYQHVVEFANKIEEDTEAIFITNSSYTTSDQNVNVNYTILFVGYRDIEVNGVDYVDVPDDVGSSDNIFSGGSKLIDKALATIQYNGDADFRLVLMNENTNGAKIYAFASSDDASEKLYYDNKTVPFSLMITQADDGVDYSYNLAGLRYSGHVITESETLTLNIVSVKRSSDSDQIGIIATVDNRSDKTLVVTTTNDDPARPRLVIGDLKGKVQVDK